MIDPKKIYRTRDGREVRIYAVDGAAPYPVHGAVKTHGRWNGSAWMSDGAYALNSSRQTETMDLIEVKPRIKRKVWLNLYPNGVNAMRDRYVADEVACHGRIACVEIDIDVEEGHGL